MQTIIGDWKRTDGTGRNSLSRLCEKVATEQLAHSVQAFNTPYRDTGLFGVYFTAGKMMFFLFSFVFVVFCCCC
jgi:processing peptidase subunit beta